MCALGKAEAPVLLLATQHIEICHDLELDGRRRTCPDTNTETT